MAELSPLAESAAAAARQSAEGAAKLAAAGDLEEARRSLHRGERRLEELKRLLPWHTRLVRRTEECLALARSAVEAPVREENDETGEIVKKRERVSRRTLRAVSRG